MMTTLHAWPECEYASCFFGLLGESSRDTDTVFPLYGEAYVGPTSNAGFAHGNLSHTLGRAKRHQSSQHPPGKWHNLSSHKLSVLQTFTALKVDQGFTSKLAIQVSKPIQLFTIKFLNGGR